MEGNRENRAKPKRKVKPGIWPELTGKTKAEKPRKVSRGSSSGKKAGIPGSAPVKGGSYAKGQGSPYGGGGTSRPSGGSPVRNSAYGYGAGSPNGAYAPYGGAAYSAGRVTGSADARDGRSPGRPSSKGRKPNTANKTSRKGRKPGSSNTARGRKKPGGAERQRDMKIWKIRAGIVGGLLGLLLIIYFVIAASYRSTFLPNTFLNGFDVGRMNAEEAENILKESVEDYALEVGFRGGKSETITGADIGLTYVSSGEASRILAEQPRLGWLMALFGKSSHYTVSTGFQYDGARLRSVLEGLPEFQADYISPPRSAGVVLDADLTYRVSDPFEGNQPDEEIVYQAVDAAVNASDVRLSLDLVDNAYVRPEMDSEDESLVERAADLNSFLSTVVTIVYRDGTTTVLDRDDLIDWVTKSEEGIYYVGEEKIYNKAYALMSAAAEKYDETKNTLDFKSTYEGTVRLKCSEYGYKVDVEEETDRLVAALVNHQSTEIELGNSVKEAIDPTFGGTYCEIDITEQCLFYYEDGKLLLSSEFVSGLESDEERRTPSGVYALFDKQRDIILGSLQAEDPSQRYESHVDYWMPFFESYGMHDASWRDEFGGDMYLYYGSHGCVNLPPSFAAELYNHIEIWTPVIVLRYSDRPPEEETAGASGETDSSEEIAGE